MRVEFPQQTNEILRVDGSGETRRAIDVWATPDGLKATLYTGSWCLCRVDTTFPACTSHSFTVASKEALKRGRGEKIIGDVSNEQHIDKRVLTKSLKRFCAKCFIAQRVPEIFLSTARTARLRRSLHTIFYTYRPLCLVHVFRAFVFYLVF